MRFASNKVYSSDTKHFYVDKEGILQMNGMEGGARPIQKFLLERCMARKGMGQATQRLIEDRKALHIALYSSSLPFSISAAVAFHPSPMDRSATYAGRVVRHAPRRRCPILMIAYLPLQAAVKTVDFAHETGRDGRDG